MTSGRVCEEGNLRRNKLVNVLPHPSWPANPTGLHTVVGELGEDYRLVRGDHPYATEDDWEVFMNKRLCEEVVR